MRVGGFRSLTQPKFPSISMEVKESDVGCDPLASPPNYHSKPRVAQHPKSFAATTRASHVQPLFEDIPLKTPVVMEGKRVVVFSPDEVGKLSSPFSWSLVGKFESGRPSLMQIQMTLKRVRTFSQEFFVGAIDDHHVIIQF